MPGARWRRSGLALVLGAIALLASALGPGPSPARAADPLSASAIDAGGSSSCAIRGDGQAVCWGNGPALGWAGSLTAAPVAGLGTGTTAISTGAINTCAIRSPGQALCWGGNYSGQLGDGTTGDRTAPTFVSGLTDATEISAGAGLGAIATTHTCGRRASGQAVCWGYNFYGQLGDGSTENRLVPTPVSGLTDAIAISAGFGHTCAIRASGQAVCWGWNSFGQLGDASTEDRLVPTAVSGLPDAVAISARHHHHTCAIRGSGEALCWGGNDNGELGDGTTTARLTPTPVSGLANAAAISTGEDHTCALRASAQAVCWGQNLSGQLGDGTTVSRLTPTPVLEGPLTSPAQPGPAPGRSVPAPLLGVRVTASVVSGKVRVRRPGSSRYARLKATESVPVGSLLDTRAGRVRILSATDRRGGTRQADFYGGRFRVLQTKRIGAVTEVRLAERLRCGAAAGASAARSKGPPGRLVWGDGEGNHRSTGRNSSASVRGTKWLVWDRCDGTTLTRVARGVVAVRDFVAGKMVLVRKGGSYVAGPRGG